MVLPKRAGEFGMKIVVNRMQNNQNVAIFAEKREKLLKYLHISEKKCIFAADFVGMILMLSRCFIKEFINTNKTN